MLYESVLGLRRAFEIAGVRTLILSLWQVDDEPTRDWMSALYRHRFVEGASTANAPDLRDAQGSVRQHWA